MLHTHRHELLMDDPQEGNVVHGKRRREGRKGRRTKERIITRM